MKYSLTWAELDTCTTAEQIVQLLRVHNIKGQQNSPTDCPLAIATGDYVNGDTRELDGYFTPLTNAQKLFVLHFDQGYYPDLETSFP